MVSQTETFAKLFFIISITGLFVYVVLAFYTFQAALTDMLQTKRVQKKIQALPDPDVPRFGIIRNEKPKHILLWTLGDAENPIGEGRKPFIDYDCLHQNCYITTNKNFLDDYIDYEAVVFNVTDLKRWTKSNFPPRRSPLQKYVFYGKQSSYDAPVCNALADDFFNWTWSYKLYSDIFSPFIAVKDMKGNMVAPSTDVGWSKKLAKETSVARTLPWLPKKKAVACILRNCGTSGKETLWAVKRLQVTFHREKMSFDIFGCKFRKCPHDNCVKAIRDDYYFYYSHESSLVEDYVTDELMVAFEAGVVPIVYGGADYSKFLPPSSYINAKSITPENLVAMVYYAIKNPTVYQGFFRWMKYYTISRTPPFLGLCQLCKMLNNQRLMGSHSHYELFRRWWYVGPLDQRCLKIESQNASALVLANNKSRGL